MDHVVPDIITEAFIAVPGLTGGLAGHRSLTGHHPFHRPGVWWCGGGGRKGLGMGLRLGLGLGLGMGLWLWLGLWMGLGLGLKSLGLGLLLLLCPGVGVHCLLDFAGLSLGVVHHVLRGEVGRGGLVGSRAAQQTRHKV